jgi:hypothetical protein
VKVRLPAVIQDLELDYLLKDLKHALKRRAPTGTL